MLSNIHMPGNASEFNNGSGGNMRAQPRELGITTVGNQMTLPIARHSECLTCSPCAESVSGCCVKCGTTNPKHISPPKRKICPDSTLDCPTGCAQVDPECGRCIECNASAPQQTPYTPPILPPTGGGGGGGTGYGGGGGSAGAPLGYNYVPLSTPQQSSPNMALIIIAILAIIGGGGWYVYKRYLQDEKSEHKTPAREQLAKT